MRDFLPSDRTTLAMLAELLTFFALYTGMAVKTNNIPWPGGLFQRQRKLCHEQVTQISTSPGWRQALLWQIGIYFAGLATASALFVLAAVHLSWSTLINPSCHQVILVIVPLMINLLLGVLVTSVLVAAVEIHLFGIVEGIEAKDIIFHPRFIIGYFFLAISLTIGVAFLQYHLNFCPTSYVAGCDISRDLLKLALSITLIQFGISSLVVPLYRTSRMRAFSADAKLLTKPNFSIDTVAAKSDEDLHRLIESALKLKRLEAADDISRYLLKRSSEKDSTAAEWSNES